MQSVPIHRILFAKSEKIIACYANKFLILNSKSGEILALPEHTISKFTNAIEIKFKEDSFIRDVAVSNSAIATISEDKSLDIYDLKTLNLLKSATTPKRANIVSISRDSNNVIVGDKFGDVVSLNLKENAEMKLLLGHISQLFDIEMSIDGKYLITADRDEKIRVSCYPLTYQIENFCLGHTDFISKIHIPILNSDLLLSGGGDSYIALWKFEQGLEIDRFDTLKYVGDSELPCCVMDIKSSPVSKMIALAFEKYFSINQENQLSCC